MDEDEDEGECPSRLITFSSFFTANRIKLVLRFFDEETELGQLFQREHDFEFAGATALHHRLDGARLPAAAGRNLKFSARRKHGIEARQRRHRPIDLAEKDRKSVV